MVQFNEEKQEERIGLLRKKEEEDLAQTLSSQYGVPYIDLTVHGINIDAIRLIKEEEARAAEIAVFNISDKNIQVAVLSPESDKAKAAIEDLKSRGYIPEIFMVSHASLRKVWDRYKDLSYSFETKSGALDISNEEILEITKKVQKLEDIRKLIQDVLGQKKAYRVSKILEIILAGGIALKASDIHLEPEEKEIRLRYRLDGVLTDILNFDKETFELLLSRIKLVSNVKLNIKEKAQDGRFSIRIHDESAEVRASLLPGPNGESVVLRILVPEAISVPLEELGIHPKLLEVLKREIIKPNGLILTTGPTGSGKTTTLYAFLKKIYSPDIKVITIENPIEYHLKGIVQTQTDEEKGYTFAEGLRSALRQDPDVIMVGEIRDAETAATAVNASLTGHLVLSTLHTNNAAGTFPRLLDLGVNPKVISSAINVSIAQRLVRKLCENCKKEVPLDGATKSMFDRVLSGITDKKYLENIQGEKIWEAVGCEKCNGLGYKGRLGIFEAILVNGAIEKAVNLNPSERDITAASRDQGLLNLIEDGILKVLKGETSLTELRRVVDLSALE
ncbi:type II/IV secretion system protein [Candidatus Parcubacteria bacterium]|nr:type II/IV secretion system protein [Candidatus Parcubacteria bacterium]